MSATHNAAGAQPMKPTLFIGEYASRNVGDGIIKLAIEKLCATHGVEATFRDFYGGTHSNSSDAPGLASSNVADSNITHANNIDANISGSNPVNSNSLNSSPTASNTFNSTAADPHTVNAPPPPPSLPQRLWRAVLRIGLVNYAIALLFYLTRYRRIAADYQVARYRQVVIGGGNLLMDNYLNFPLLILRVVQQCERHGVPVKLFSVGAGKGYSRLGRRIMARIVQSPIVACVVCRDRNSHALIQDIAGKAAQHKVLCSVDSGLYLNRSDAHTTPTSTVGLGVIAPSVLQAVTPDHPMADARYALQWWDTLIEGLSEHIGAERIELISNGSGVDNDFAYAVWQALSPKYPGLSVCTAIASPADLLRRIGSYQALAAYRMHAAVTAMALDVPVVGFEWDPKVLQLFTYCGKREACIPLAEFTQHSARDIIAALLHQTPTQLASIRQALDRDFRHATTA